MVDHGKKLTNGNGTIQNDRIPVLLVHMVAGAHGVIPGTKFQGLIGIAFKVERWWLVGKAGEEEHLAVYFDDEGFLVERKVFDDFTGFSKAVLPDFLNGDHAERAGD